MTPKALSLLMFDKKDDAVLFLLPQEHNTNSPDKMKEAKNKKK